MSYEVIITVLRCPKAPLITTILNTVLRKKIKALYYTKPLVLIDLPV